MKQHDAEDVVDYKRDALKDAEIKEVQNMKVEYVEELAKYWKNNLTTVFKRKKDLDVANAVVELIEMRDNIDNFNKKALYILIREMTGSNTQHITRVINVMKKHHNKLQTAYLTTGSIDTKSTGSWSNL
jgi:translation initiation factor RLI1